MTTHTDLYGLILAGGQSARMGFDKRLMKVHAQNQQEYLTTLLGRYCEKIFLSCKDATEIPVHLNPLVDQFEMRSPLNGIASALMLHPQKDWLIVAVDMPFVDDECITTLLKQRSQQYLATCFLDSDDKLPEPMLGVWERGAQTALTDYIKAGNKSPRLFLEQHAVNCIKSNNKKTLLNINTQEELDSL